MAPTVESLIEGFPNPSILPIVGEPTYETITAVARQLKANAASVQTELGGGALGHLAIVMSPVVYATLSATPFVNPVNPGALPVIPPGTTAAQIQAIIRHHESLLHDWRLFTNIDKALRQQLTAAVNRMYIRALEHPHIGFANVTTLQLLQHLLTTYGRITAHPLHENDTFFRKAMDISLPFEAFVTQIDEAVEYASAGETPYTAAQIVANSYNLVFQTGLFPEACREWRKRPPAEHTWLNFKTDFAEAHRDYRLSVSSTQAQGYHGANAITENFLSDTADAFANLATATTADRTMLAELSKSNTELLKQLSTKDTTIARLQAQLQQQRSNRTPGAGRGTGSKRPDSAIRRNTNDNYCWTHGWDVAITHKSQTCSFPHEGHKAEATRSNTMGGSDRNKALVT